MSDEEKRGLGAEAEPVIELDFAKEDLAVPAVAEPIWGIPPQKGISGEDLLGAHLHLTAPDLAVLIPPMANLEFREDACKLYRGLNPRNTSEAMVATLTVGLFNASMASISEATRQDAPVQVRDINFRNGVKAAASAVEFLDKLHQMQGSQTTVRVGNVNVEAGGRAIVGHVQSGRHQVGLEHKNKKTPRSQKRKRKRKSASPDIIDV